MEHTQSLRTTTVTISGRKLPGYPTVTFETQFNSIEDLIMKIDDLIENQAPDYGKVDVVVEDIGFTLDETNRLEEEWISVV